MVLNIDVEEHHRIEAAAGLTDPGDPAGDRAAGLDV
jgi:hypothetical protein